MKYLHVRGMRSNNRFERWRGSRFGEPRSGSIIWINQLRLTARNPASLNLIVRPMEGTMAASKLYTPQQIRAGSFLGGPIAAVFFLRENFRVLDMVAEAGATLIWGAAFVVGLMILLPFLPDHFPSYVISLTYSFEGRVRGLQMATTKGGHIGFRNLSTSLQLAGILAVDCVFNSVLACCNCRNVLPKFHRLRALVNWRSGFGLA